MDDPITTHEFVLPVTKVKNDADMKLWMKSSAYNDFLGFLTMLNAAVKGKPSSTLCQISPRTQALLDLLDTLSQWVDDCPAIEQPQRFGNKAFRTWMEKLRENATKLVQNILPENLQRAAEEVADYLINSFGNQTRIDYGTGHEASFAAFLCILYKLRLFTTEDQLSLATKVFVSYLNLARKLQKTYRMEPAGSQGVWGLDDYQFIPFIWGSSQLCMNPDITPKDFVEPKVVNKHHEDFMFLECIKYINEVKTGPFAEHSNTLWGISGVPHWSKVNSGLIKMYKAEMLHKFPVIQHFRFGSILSFTEYK
nr:serine/threonine-protein phosphatase 2A activator-like [Ciona intestinalis]|eukprot:XP_002128200.1 serine/threonine-protein phosphatase 2A activator-like [Ciona intestinalis]